jgi:pimeloyl-ACP methyl ester carboxylesterase
MSLPDTVVSRRCRHARLETHYLERPGDGPVVVLVHGNVSSSRFFAEWMTTLPADWRVLAPDFRGYGDSEPLPLDATRGVRDLSDDAWSWLDALGVEAVHLLGWSVGGGVVQQMTLEAPARVRSLTLLAPVAPYGFGGTRGEEGTPVQDDFAGCGGGAANPDFVTRLGDGDRSDEADTSPRNIFRAFYVAPGFDAGELEDAYVDAMLSTVVGPEHYPGDGVPSPHWPGFAPGVRGMNNAISGAYLDLSGIVAVSPKPPVLWVRGAEDLIVSDGSFFEIGFLGQQGFVPGWPGDDVAPPQPMIGQTRAVFEAYVEAGGELQEVVLSPCGHAPHLEHPETVREAFAAHVASAG